MDAFDTAQSILPEIARPLQKYLRITRQQPRHSTDAVLAHIATALRFDLAPRAFLERYLVPSPVLQVSHGLMADWDEVCWEGCENTFLSGGPSLYPVTVVTMYSKYFLQKSLFASNPLFASQNDRERRVPVQTWALICDALLSRSVKAGTVFQLRQNGSSGAVDDVSLLCQVILSLKFSERDHTCFLIPEYSRLMQRIS